MPGLIIGLLSCCLESKEGFVKVVNEEFQIDGKPYVFIGANYWQGMNLSAPESGDRKRVLRELDHLQ